MAADNMKIIHVSSYVLSTLMSLQQENLRKLKQQIHHQRQSSVGALKS